MGDGDESEGGSVSGGVLMPSENKIELRLQVRLQNKVRVAEIS